MKSEIGLIGLGVMGKSLSRNIAKNGFQISLYNRQVVGVEENIAKNSVQQYSELERALPFDDLRAFVHSIEQPRIIVLMVNAGQAVDDVLQNLNEFLADGDIIIDGGNSHFEDTNRRIAAMKAQNLFFIGAGISGGEEGAFMGPSIMPSGNSEAYLKVNKYFETIAAKDDNGNPCCAYVGDQGSGHFVKMVHNGIEYAEMQLLAECYAILKGKALTNEQIANEFESWKKGLGSYLLSITVDILRKKDGDAFLIDKILDKAGNKGTGKWASVSITDYGEPATMIPAALFARYLSFFKDRRLQAAKLFSNPSSNIEISNHNLKDAYQFGRIINHYQGFSLIGRVSKKNNWNVDLSEIARIWTAGCIIKSELMKELVDYLKTGSSLLTNKRIISAVNRTHPSAKLVVAECVKNEIHIPCLLDATNFFHGLKTANSSANIIQAQRDYFGAHTYQRKDDTFGKMYRTEW